MARKIETISQFPDLYSKGQGHLSHLEPRVWLRGTEKREFLKAAMEQFGQTRVISAESFIHNLVNDSRNNVRTIGQRGIRPEAFILSVENSVQRPKVLKLGLGSGLQTPATQRLMEMLYPTTREPRKLLGQRLPFQQTPTERMQTLLRGDESTTGLQQYFTSAEILVRAVAHTLLPETMSAPVALLNDNEEPVGFYLEHDQPVVRTENMARTESLFGDFNWLEWREADLPRVVSQTRRQLEEVNVHIWNEVMWDLQEQLLLDPGFQFVTFGRLGYVLPQAMEIDMGDDDF